MLSYICFASSVIDKSVIANNNQAISMHNDSSFEKDLNDSNINIVDEDVVKVYMDEMAEAFEKVKLPIKYNLPTLLTQPTDHPIPENDFFGINKDEMPIFSVKVSDDDEERKGCMCLTFDSAYINTYTFQILDILDKYNIKSTFFMTYEFMQKNPSHVMEIIKRGHEIGNHSTSHPDFNKISDSKIVVEVMKAHNFIKDLVGAELSLFRFPYGSYSSKTITFLKSLGYYPIQWTLDSIDWRNLGKEYLIEKFTDNDKIAEGSIVLFHNGATYTPEALPEIIEMIYDKGLKCVRVSDLIYKHNFYLKNGIQIEGKFETTSE